MIVLADGVVSETRNCDIDFGGKTLTVCSGSGDPDACIIDCGGSSGTPHRGFRFHNGEGPGAVVQGITIRKLWEGSSTSGGAVRCENQSTPHFVNCVFRSCYGFYGGAVAADYSRPRLERCLLVCDRGVVGSGLYAVNHSWPYLTNCTIAADTNQTGAGAAMQAGSN